MNTTGFKELEKKLASLQEEEAVPFEVLFDDTFMQNYTSFQNIQELLKNSGFTISSNEDFQKVPDQEWDEYIQKVTEFPNWEEMKQTAGVQYMKKKLKKLGFN